MGIVVYQVEIDDTVEDIVYRQENKIEWVGMDYSDGYKIITVDVNDEQAFMLHLKYKCRPVKEASFNRAANFHHPD